MKRSDEEFREFVLRRAGAPVRWTPGPGTHPAQSTTTYELRCVTVSAIAAGKL